MRSSSGYSLQGDRLATQSDLNEYMPLSSGDGWGADGVFGGGGGDGAGWGDGDGYGNGRKGNAYVGDGGPSA